MSPPTITSTDNASQPQKGQKQVWLITGCSTGFGHQLAAAALAHGHAVIATSRNASNLGSLVELGATPLTLDPSWPLDKLRATVDDVLARHNKRIDVLINNAAFILQGAIEELTPEDDLAAYGVNVFGPLNMMRCVLPYMRLQRSGTIINIGSLAGWEGTECLAAYCGTKFAIAGISECVALEVKEFGIRVVSVEPGYFRTNLLQGGGGYKRGSNEQMIKSGVYANSKNLHAFLEQTNGKQPGDPKKGAEAIVGFIETEGELPLRWVVGRDVREEVEKKWATHKAVFDKWKPITDATAFEE